MPAERDKSQKPTFLFTNLHALTRGLKAGQTEATPVGLVTGKVLKAGVDPSIKAYVPVEFEPSEAAHRQPDGLRPGLRVERPPVLRSVRTDERRQAVESLRRNLRDLSEIHERLKFLLKEIEKIKK